MSIQVAEFEKVPAAKLDFQMSWVPWLDDGDAVATANWTASAGITISSSPAPSLTANVATVWLEGGTEGNVYTLTCSITTTGGRSDARTFAISIR
jgi:hypothetical protein